MKPNISGKKRDRGPITTKTQSVSFDLEIYAILEKDRKSGRRPIPRSAYIREALEERFVRRGLLKIPGSKKGS